MVGAQNVVGAYPDKWIFRYGGWVGPVAHLEITSRCYFFFIATELEMSIKSSRLLWKPALHGQAREPDLTDVT